MPAGDKEVTEQFTGKVEIVDGAGNVRMTLNGGTGDATLGGAGQDGDMVIKNRAGVVAIHLDGDGTNIILKTRDGKDAIIINGSGADIRVGGNGSAGDITVRDHEGKSTIHLDGNAGDAMFGGSGQNGRLLLRSQAGDTVILIDGGGANITVGGSGSDGDITVKNREGKDTIHLNGDAGDIYLLNADCAEDFDVAEFTEVEAGDVVVFNERAALQQSSQAYDRRVAGVVSGAGETRPGIILGRQRSGQKRLPVGLAGKVNCKVDAQFGSIEIGDLLTTSPTPGHAMKAGDPLRAFGAVIGKALASLPAGQGVIPILIALQ